MNFSHYKVKQYGAQYIKDNADKIALALDVLKADTHVQATNKVIASASMTGADVTLAANGEDLEITINGKSIDPVATADAIDDLVVLIFNDTGTEVLLCLDATDRIITNDAGDTVQIPALQTFVRELSAV